MNRIAFYVFFEKKGIVREYVTYYLKGLQKIASKVVIVVNGELAEQGRESLNQIGVDIIIRENIGVDFWAYKAGMEAQGTQLESYDEMVFSNCSCYGPIYPFNEMFAKMAPKSCDFWGITDWPENQGGYHGTWIMSYFMVFRKSILSTVDWKNYWKNLCPVNSREESIALHETKFTSWFVSRGFHYEVYCKNPFKYLDITIEGPDELIITQKCPLIKRKALCFEYERFLAYHRGGAALKAFDYLQKNNLYDINMILEDLLATQHYEHLKNCLHLNYFLSSEVLTNSKDTNGRVALCFHITHEKLLDNSLKYILSMPGYADLYITTSKPELFSIIKEKCYASGVEKAFIKLTKARGGSESAFLVDCSSFIYNYDYVCIVNDNYSSFEPSIIGTEFGLHNLDSLLKTKNYVRNILNLFENNKKLGMLVPIHIIYAHYREFYGNEWDSENHKQTVALLQEFSIDLPIDFSVPPILSLGGMFWFRPICLKKLIDKRWNYEHFPEESFSQEEHFNHAIKRAYPFFVQDSGYLIGWVSSIIDAQIHLTNISYLYRNCKIDQENVLSNLKRDLPIINNGLKQKVKKFMQRKIPQKLLPLAKKLVRSKF